MCIPEPYWTDPHQSEFDITITKVDKNTFYTEEKLPIFLGGGGQPQDTAILVLQNGETFLLKEAFEKSFILKKKIKLEKINNLPITANLKIDMKLRQAYMRAHTSQHILSAIIKTKYGIDTTKAVLEDDEAKLFFDKKLSPSQLSELLGEFYKIMENNLKITSRVIKKGTNVDLNGNKVDLEAIRGGIPTDEQCIRLVEVEGIDLNTCGGTHLAHSSEALALLFTDLKKDHITFKVGRKALKEFGRTQEFILNLINKTALPYAKAIERTAEIVDSYPLLQKNGFDLSKTLVKSIFSLINTENSKNLKNDFALELGNFSNDPISKQNLPVKAWKHNNILFIMMNLSFLNRTAFLTSIIDFSYPTVIIAELEKENLICQTTNEKEFSAKLFLEKFMEKTNVKGGGSDKQIQCSIKKVNNLYELIPSVINELK
ncbi:MAG: hypothetical protein ACW967_00365 [Candidatus Hodarchaeales archaeon]|jgi:misacylated tRNA(Ala) deacylase